MMLDHVGTHRVIQRFIDAIQLVPILVSQTDTINIIKLWMKILITQ